MGPCLAVFHDGEVIQPCLEKTGCPRAKCGRRAPHLSYSTLLVSFVCLISWMMPKYADQATQSQIDKTARLSSLDMTNATYRVKDSDGKWKDDWKPFPGVADYLHASDGMPCGQMLQILTPTTVVSFNDTTPVVGVANYGNDICASLVSTSAVCWPGPSGNPTKVGDGGPRVCSFTAGNSLALWFFVMAFVGRIGWESQWMLSNAAKWEIYPWIEERMKNNVWTSISTALGVIAFAGLSIPVGGAHEMGSAPNGGGRGRLIFSIITAFLCLLGFVSIKPWSDAKQATKKHAKAVNQCVEWKDILSSPNTGPMRWVTFTYFIASIQGTFTVSTVVYYFVYVSMVRLESVGISVAGVAFLTLVLESVMAKVWSCIFAKGTGAERADSKTSQQLRWYYLIFHIISAVLALVGGIFVAPVVARDQVGSPVQLMVFMSIFRIPGSIYSAWLATVSGWAIDHDYHESCKLGDGKAKRREASWAGLRLFFRGLGGVIGFLIIASVMGGPGIPAVCNSKIAAKDQDMACPQGIWFLWTILNPIFLLIMGISGFMFPIHGERLVALIKKQGAAQIARPGTKAALLTNTAPVESSAISVVKAEVVASAASN